MIPGKSRSFSWQISNGVPLSQSRRDRRWKVSSSICLHCSLGTAQAKGTRSFKNPVAQYTEEKCRVIPLFPVLMAERKTWGKALSCLLLNLSVVFQLLLKSNLLCITAHILSLDYSILSVAHASLSSPPLALTVPPASLGLQLSTVLRCIVILFYDCLLCLPYTIHSAQ